MSVTLLNYEVSPFTASCVPVGTINLVVLRAGRAWKGSPCSWGPGAAPFITCVLAHANLIWAFLERSLNLLLFNVDGEPGCFRLVSGCILNMLLTAHHEQFNPNADSRERKMNAKETSPQ